MAESVITPSENVDRLTRKRIIEAASVLFEQKGVEATSVAEIAEESGLSAPEALRCVRRKVDIMLMIMEDFTEKFKMAFDPKRASSDPKEQLQSALDTYCRIVDREAVKVVLVYRYSRYLSPDGRSKIKAAEREHAAVFETIIKNGVATKTFKPVDAGLMSYNLVMIAHTWALKSWHFKKRYVLDDYIRLQTDMVFGCLAF